MKVVTIAIGISLSAFLMTGCGGGGSVDSTHVTPQATKATAKISDLDTKKDQLESGGEFKDNMDTSTNMISSSLDFLDSLDLFRNLSFSKRTKTSSFSTRKMSKNVFAIATSTNENSCVDTSEVEAKKTEDNATHTEIHTAKGTINFTNCKDNGYTLTATMIVDFQETWREDDDAGKRNVFSTYLEKLDLKDVTVQDLDGHEVKLDLLKISNSEVSNHSWGNGSFSSSSDSNSSLEIQTLTITSGIEQKLLLKLDGINAKMTNKYASEDNLWSSSYTAIINGYIGDEDGMYKVSTPTTVSGGYTADFNTDEDNAELCPTKGEIVIEGSDGKVSLKANNGNLTLNGEALSVCD